MPSDLPPEQLGELLVSAAPTGDFPDLQTAVWTRLQALAGGAGHGGSVTPADLEQRLPFIQAVRLPGSDDGVTDTATIDVDVYARTRAQAWALAGDCRRSLTSRPFAVVLADGTRVVVDRVVTVASPIEPPVEQNETTAWRRFTASYSVRARRVVTRA